MRMTTIELTPPVARAPRLRRKEDAGVELIFDLEVGGMRRRYADEIAMGIAAAGVDVSWNDRRVGLCGRRRRFVVRGQRHVIDELVSAIAVTVGWQPGAVSLRGL